MSSLGAQLLRVDDAPEVCDALESGPPLSCVPAIAATRRGTPGIEVAALRQGAVDCGG